MNSARVTHHSSNCVVVEGLKEGLLKKRKEGSDAAGGEEELPFLVTLISDDSNEIFIRLSMA